MRWAALGIGVLLVAAIWIYLVKRVGQTMEAQGADRNACEEVIKTSMSPSGPAESREALMVETSGFRICDVTFRLKNQRIEKALFAVKEGEAPWLIDDTGAQAIPECGGESRDIQFTPVLLKAKDGSTFPALAVEKRNEIIPCCGQQLYVRSNLYIYDLDKRRASNEIPIHDFCEADQSCGAKCDPTDKALVDRGTEYRFNFYACGEGCEAIPFEKRIRGKSLKPTDFRLEWDENFRIREVAL